MPGWRRRARAGHPPSDEQAKALLAAAKAGDTARLIDVQGRGADVNAADKTGTVVMDQAAMTLYICPSERLLFIGIHTR